jgi:hypothetical protein
VKKLDNLKWEPSWVSHQGCVKGITIKGGATDGKIYRNHVHGLTRGQRTGLYIDAWGETATSNLEVFENVIHDCESGVTLGSEDGGLVQDIRIYNNVVYENHSNGLEIGDLGEPLVRTRPIRRTEIVNNTAYGNGSVGWGSGFYNGNPDATDIVVRNNIFSQNVIAQSVNESKAALVVDCNLIDGTQEYDYAISGSDYIVGDPLFANADEADFHLLVGSPAIDKATSSGAPSADFEGNPRPSGAGYDMGAFEYLE